MNSLMMLRYSSRDSPTGKDLPYATLAPQSDGPTSTGKKKQPQIYVGSKKWISGQNFLYIERQKQNQQ